MRIFFSSTRATFGSSGTSASEGNSFTWVLFPCSLKTSTVFCQRLSGTLQLPEITKRALPRTIDGTHEQRDTEPTDAVAVNGPEARFPKPPFVGLLRHRKPRPFPWVIDSSFEEKIYIRYIRWCCIDLLSSPCLSGN
jgi:hypothetical protein